ncbi:hypothetical protein EVAR_45668_1 [Eumeta japonica]|uniref:Uncharacterized protein n=1 Tax=Eumeta variegata TaxID=151549 RepID=A0A4C1Y2F5_EUMVA|nr:hypothetical protein EVAR_45668_1 [Eumeta japonica]
MPSSCASSQLIATVRIRSLAGGTTQYGREVAAFAVVFRLVSESSGDPLLSSSHDFPFILTHPSLSARYTLHQPIPKKLATHR